MRTLCSVVCSHFESKERQNNSAAKSECAELSAFQHIVDQYAPRVQAVLYSIFGDPHAAEEISVRVFARAYARLSLSRQLWVDLVRLTIKESQRVRWTSVVLDNLGLHKDQRNKQDGVRNRALGLLASLPWRDRVLVVLREVAELSPEQIATVLDSTPQRVRADLLDARLTLLKVSKA